MLPPKDFQRPFMEIKKSTIRNAGKGVFATDYIPAGMVMDEYKGKKVSLEEVDKYHADNDYLFAINNNKGEIIHAVDAEDLQKSNWTRFVNGARTPAQRQKINVRFQQYGKKMYLETLHALLPGEEMICDYGPMYW
jgi:hypothetical protein